MGRVRWMAVLAVAMAAVALVLSCLGLHDHALAWAICSVTAAGLANIR